MIQKVLLLLIIISPLRCFSQYTTYVRHTGFAGTPPTYPVTIPGSATAYTNLEQLSGWTKDASSSISPNPPTAYNIVQSGTPVTMTLQTTGTSGLYTGWMAKKGVSIDSTNLNMVLRATYTFDSVVGIQAWEVGRRLTNGANITDNGQTQLVPISGGLLEFDIVPSSSGGWADTGCRFPTFVAGTQYTEELYYINDSDGALSLMYVELNGTVCTIPSSMQHIAGAVQSPAWTANATTVAFQPDADPTGSTFNAVVTMNMWMWASGGAPPQITFTPPAGTYTGAQSVSIATTLTGGTIFYTTDGSTPSIASNIYTGPITVSSSQTILAVAAVIAVSANNQNQNTNIGTGTQHWKAWCYLPGCNPGGSGVPQSTSQTFGITALEHNADGTSMNLTIESDASVTQTNALKTEHAGDCSSATCTQFLHDFWIYYDPSTFANLSEDEHDTYWFDDTDGIRYMYGLQWNKSGGHWQIGGNSNVPWTDTSVTTALTSGTWNHVQLLVSRVPSELTSLPCNDGTSNWPYLYYKQLNINGTTNFVNMQICANANPSGWTGTGMQHQIDIHNTNAYVSEYFSADNFMATGDSISPVGANYIIH